MNDIGKYLFRGKAETLTAPNECFSGSLAPVIVDKDTNEIKTKDEDGNILHVGSGSVRVVKTLSSAEVLDLDSTPIEIVGAAGVGKAIVPLSIQTVVKFNSVAYAGGFFVKLNSVGGAQNYATITADAITAPADRISNSDMEYRTAPQTAMTLNTGVEVLATAAIINGDSEVTFDMTYKIVEV